MNILPCMSMIWKKQKTFLLTILTDCEKTLARTGYIHIAFSVGSKDAVDALTERLKKAGFEVVSGPRTTGDGYYESCIVAIEDNQIEITV